MEQALATGTQLGCYEVLDRLGKGGMGEVYRARDTRLGRLVALKVLRLDADPELLRRLDREARAASSLNHPNIVHIYDVGEAPTSAGAHYVVMELVEGETLRRRLRPGPFPMPELLGLAAQLADGVAVAHRAGIVHRDLKPENLMVTLDGTLKILDFGLAKRVTAALGEIDAGETLSRHATRAGTLLGTLEYMSPEQATGRAVDHRTDQFSLGLILHEMATGRAAFHRDTPAQVLAAVIERDPEPLGRLRPDVPAGLEALVVRCLQKDPERRFAKTDELSAELFALSGRSRGGSLAGAAGIPQAASGGVSQAAGGSSRPAAGGIARPAAVTAEVVPPLPPPLPGPSVYNVQKGRRVRRYDEGELAQLIRRGRLTGVELVRRDDEEHWQPLFESRVYRREVPTAQDPRDEARLRLLRGLLGHLSGFFIVSVVMYSTQGQLPFWLAIWGAVLGMQALRTAPAAWMLLRRRQAERELPAAAPAPAAPDAQQLLAAGPAGGSSTIAQEAARVRALIEQRKLSDAAGLLAEVDRILGLTAELAARQADLEEQTSERERDSLAASIAQARARLERAELDQDRRLFERQLEVLVGREETIAKALRVLERLRVRREVAEHQLKQLRLDLSRGAASSIDAPELSSRLQFIRDEVDAREEVAEIGARRR